MIANPPHARLTATPLWADLMLVAFLVGLVAVARLLPHAPNFTPVVGAALFAGATLHRRSLALAVPVLAMLVSDAAIGFEGWGERLVIYAALMLPAAIGIAARRFRVSRMLLPAALASSLVFFAASNFAVWWFSGMYGHDTAGLAACFVAALPFLHLTVAGDLFWSAALFGGAFLVQYASARLRPQAEAATHA
jgi:hypothetical protein